MRIRQYSTKKTRVQLLQNISVIIRIGTKHPTAEYNIGKI